VLFDEQLLTPECAYVHPKQKPLIAIMAEQLVLRGTLEGHSGWVTSLATSLEKCVYAGRGKMHECAILTRD